MKTKELIPVILQVLKNPKVIITTIVMLLIIAFANFIVNYSKKARKVKTKKTAAPAPAPAQPSEPKVDMSENEA